MCRNFIKIDKLKLQPVPLKMKWVYVRISKKLVEVVCSSPLPQVEHCMSMMTTTRVYISSRYCWLARNNSTHITKAVQ